MRLQKVLFDGTLPFVCVKKQRKEEQKMKKFLSALLVVLMALSMFAGCANNDATADNQTSDSTEAPVVTEAPAEEPTAEPAEEPTAEPTDEPAPQISGTMKVVATSESYVELFDVFTEQTGVKVELLSMSSGEVLSKLRAEGGTPSADLWFGGGIDAFMGAKDDGLLEQVNFDGAAELNPTYKDADNYWFSKGLTIVGFLVNDSLMAEKNMTAPATWEDLLNEQYKGEIVMSNPAISGTNYGVVNAMLQTKGEEAGWEYFNKLNENIAFYGRRGSDPKNKVIAGEFAIGITYLDGTIDALVEEYDVSIVYPTDGIPYIPEGVAVFKNADNVEAAKYFVEWLFSNDENLQLLAKIDQKNSVKVIKPSLEGVELGYDMNILMTEDISLFGAQREAILAQFETLMGDKAVTE